MYNTILSKDELFNHSKIKDLIYHYTSTKVLIESILPKNSIKFNSLENTNDPLEFQNYIIKYNQSFTYNIFEVGIELNKILKKGFKICCFSIDSSSENDYIFNKGFCRSRMWSQYADNNRGVCLIFNKKMFEKCMFKWAKELNENFNDKVFIYNKPIKYDDSLDGLNEALTVKISGNPKNYIHRHIEKYIDNLLFLKVEDYSSENEYRIGLYSKAFDVEDEIFINYENSLEGIILGTNFCTEYLINIHQFNKYSGVTIFSLNWENGKPELDTNATMPIGSIKPKASLF